MAPPRDAELAAFFDTHFNAVHAYAIRRAAQPADAEEVVAETFVVAWRRWADVPADEDERLPWLYGVARRVLANQRRGARRRLQLLDRMRSVFVKSDDAGGRAGDVTAALRSLSAPEQELLRLVAWEGLSHREAAIVLGLSPNAVAIRLHRARQRLRAAMDPLNAVKGLAPSRTWTGWKGNVEPSRHREETP